ncbi:SH3 domain-containing protein [Celeribacter sp.]|uniref:SH3 domain-containing protein n=1 Tax=Celeribacter sp. TaxID=1890673 RepID=UPI003A928FC3
MVQYALLAALVALVLTGQASAQDTSQDQAPSQSAPQAEDAATTDSETVIAPSPAEPQSDRGTVTNLPLPRFVSLKANKANLRRGPSLSHRIDWVFKQRGYPFEVIAEYGHWRRVRDNEGATGWIHYTLISGVRTAVVTDSMVDLYRKPDTASRLSAQAEKGAILKLLECNISWCQASAGGYKGWLLKSGIWGVYDDEILE